MEEDKLKFEFIASPNFWPGRKVPCTVLVYHYTAGGPIESCVKYFQQKDGTSAHFVIERDGKIVQMVKLTDRAWHAGESIWKGVKGVNNFSIGVEICNWGLLKKKGNDYFCWPKDYSQKFTGIEPFKDSKGDFWENYPEAQIKSLINVSKFILEKFPTITLDNIIGHENIAPGRKKDPGSAFLWEVVKSELKR